jgi:tetratricopeptide (TPR) repeat protein/pimeloyl-ACP methyl ester carboxylesterase
MGYGDQIFILDFVKFTLGKLVGERTILTPNEDNNQLERAHVPRDERGDFIFVSFDAEGPAAQYTGHGNGLAHVLNNPAPRVEGPVHFSREPIEGDRRFNYDYEARAERVIAVVGFPAGWSANHFHPWPTDAKHVNDRLVVKFDLFGQEKVDLKWEMVKLDADRSLEAEVGRIKRGETGANSEKTLLLFIHGLGGSGEETWDKFPQFLRQDEEFARKYEIAFFSYPTMLVRTIFSRKAPSIQELAAGLRTQIENRYADFPSVVLVCHSLGGLIARKYLLDEFKAKRQTRVKGIVLFAVPNNGADLAGIANVISWRHRQVRQLCRGSDLIELLNEDWYTMGLPKVVRAKYVTGTQDRVVDRFSARATWGNPDVDTVIGKGHRDIVTPERADDDAVLILKRFLKGPVITQMEGAEGLTPETKGSGDIVGEDKIEQHIYQAPVPVIAPLHQLPPPPADFTGREAELRDLHSAIAKGGVHISGLQGQGGVGKTALALKLAAELGPNFPDAQIYLDLKGVSEKPLTAAEALSHLLRAFHPEAKLPEKERELLALFRHVLHDKRALLLMDNAKDAAQVKSLIPPEGCALLITSRFRFTLPGLHQRNLDTFRPDDATKLLLKIAPRIGPAAEPIAKLCGYLALALRLVATAIAEHIDLSPENYRQKLADEKQRLKLLDGTEEEGVEASITLSYNLLDDESKKRWRMLSVFPDTFDAPAAASVLGVETGAAADEAKATLTRFLQYSMLEWDDATKRYRLHDLMRDFARERRTPTESDTADLRHARHYLTVLKNANDLNEKGSESITIGFALFDVEWGNIQAGQAWAAAHGANDQETAKLCSGYPDQGANILEVRQHPRESIRWRQAALTAVRQLKDRAVEGHHLSGLGSAYEKLGDARRAIEYHEEALTIAREIGDRRAVGISVGNLGAAYQNLGDIRRAIEYHEQDLAIAREIGDRRGESRALGNLGLAYYRLGDYRRSIEYHEKCLAIAREIGYQQGEGQALGNLGVAYQSSDDNKRAIECHEQRLVMAREIGDRAGESAALGNLGLAYKNLGDVRRAIEYQEQRLVIAREIGDRRGESEALGNLGNAHRLQGDYSRATEYCKQDLEIAREIENRYGEATALGNLGLVLDELGDRKSAISHTELALKIFEEIESPYAADAREQLEKWRTG